VDGDTIRGGGGGLVEYGDTHEGEAGGGVGSDVDACLEVCGGEARGSIDVAVNSCGGESGGGGGPCHDIEDVDGSVDELDVVGS
jgi:hypothetical protein